MLDYDTENLNSEEIYSSLRGVTEAIEKFSFRSQEDLNEPIKRDGRKDCDIVSIRRLMEGGLCVVTTQSGRHPCVHPGVVLNTERGVYRTPAWFLSHS